MDSSELFKMLRFRVSVAFYVPLQICFAAEAACAVWAFVEVVCVGFWAGFLFHSISFFRLADLKYFLILLIEVCMENGGKVDVLLGELLCDFFLCPLI